MYYLYSLIIIFSNLGSKKGKKILFLHIMKVIPLVARIDGPDGFETLTHFTDHQSGVLLCLSGHAGFTVGAKQYDMAIGDMLIIVPFSNLVLSSLSQDFKGIICMVDLEFVFSAITPVHLTANMQFVILHPLSHPSDSDMAALLSLLNLIEQRSQFIKKSPLSEMMTDNLINALAYLVLDSYLNVTQTETKNSDTKESIMLAFHADLSRDYLTHRKVSHYAGLQNLTPRYFSTAIKAISGYTPLYWINTAVAAEAKRLMRNSNMSIKEISYSLNFPSPTFFTRWYRVCTGETPSQYRTRCRIILAHNND